LDNAGARCESRAVPVRNIRMAMRMRLKRNATRSVKRDHRRRWPVVVAITFTIGLCALWAGSVPLYGWWWPSRRCFVYVGGGDVEFALVKEQMSYPAFSYGVRKSGSYRWLPSYNTIDGWRISVPLWMPVIVSGVLTMLLLHRARQPIPGRCRCGYDLANTTSGRCPECGRPIPLRRSI
jgi:hypothetical protein